MPSNNTKFHPQQPSLDASSVLHSLYEQQYYITNLDGFLTEKDTVKALSYWLEEYTELQNIKSTDDIINIIHRSISEIDHLINDQLNEIIHHPKLKKLEASWRGLWFLVVQSEEAKSVKIKLLNVSWSEVHKDISRSMDFDQSQLFHKIYSEEYGISGGEPYGVLIGDYEISHSLSKNHKQDDIETLQGMAEIAAAAFTPFIAGASPELFGLDEYSGLGQPINLKNIFSQKEYIRWNSMRDRVDTRFVGLTLPRILMRLPYRSKPGSYKGIFFYEKTATSSNENYLWGNACFGFASILIREFCNIGWFGHIRGVKRNHLGGGLLTNLPVDYFETDADNISFKPVTDVIITDRLEREISELGLIPLCQCYDTPFAAFYNNQALHRPPHYTQSESNINAKLSVMLQHILCGSRIAHYIKVIFRDKIGSYSSAQMVENDIDDWLTKYTSANENLGWEAQARYPLREARVQVKEHPAKPGEFMCIIHLRPHYQLDQMVSELELATELKQAG